MKKNIILYIAFANKTGPFFIPYACAEAIDNNHVGFFQRWKRRYFKLREGNKLYYAKSSEVRRSMK